MIKFSLILVTFNRIKSLRKTLDSLSFSLEGFNNWELFIIDNCSNDGTIDYCTAKFKDSGRVKIISNGIRSAYVSRNIGIKNSSGEYLMFLEDDLIIPRDWFSKIAALSMERPDERVFTYSIKSQGKFSNVLTAIQEQEKENALKKRELTGCVSCPSFLIKKTVFDKLGLFSENNRGGDIDFTLRLLKNNEKITLRKEVFVYHEFAHSLNDFMKRSFAYGYSFSENNNKYGGAFAASQKIADKIMKNMSTPFRWAKNMEGNYIFNLLLCYIHELSFISGGLAHKSRLKKNPVT